jgi:hypothetical protein
MDEWEELGEAGLIARPNSRQPARTSFESPMIAKPLRARNRILFYKKIAWGFRKHIRTGAVRQEKLTFNFPTLLSNL